MAHWFPSGKNGNSEGWRLDIVSLLAVIGESSIEEHSQALTSSWTCMLPRIIPAPQALLKPTRPTRLPQTSSAVVGIHNGTLVPTLNYFADILHPLDDLPRFGFKVLKITHRSDVNSNNPMEVYPRDTNVSTTVDRGDLENYSEPQVRRQSTFRELTHTTPGKGKQKPRVPPHTWSPLRILSVGSCLLTISLLILAIVVKDGTACLALGTISLCSSIVGYGSLWSPLLEPRFFRSKVPSGDVAIRTREGAFLIVKCDEIVARELYIGSEECDYRVETWQYRIMVGFGTLLLMVSVVLLGNCDFIMQAAIGASYMVLNGLFWAASLIPKDRFWDLSSYIVEDITPGDAKNADQVKRQSDDFEGMPSFTRTLWYAIRETKKIGWVKKCGAAPDTPQWDQWLDLAELNATEGNRLWDAVGIREEIIGQPTIDTDAAQQHAPAFEIPINPTK